MAREDTTSGPRDHILSRDCWCQPEVVQVSAGNPLDGSTSGQHLPE